MSPDKYHSQTDHRSDSSPTQWDSLRPSQERRLTPEQYKQAAIEELGSALHDAWRQPRLLEDGTYEPRTRVTTDQEWIGKHSTDIVDIANTDFTDLPQDWRQENYDTAGALVELLGRFRISSSESLNGKYPSDEDKDSYDACVRRMASEVHDAWLSRENNAWAKGGDLDVPFDQLPKDEQAKDIARVELAIAIAQADAFAVREEGSFPEVYYFNKYGVECGYGVLDEEGGSWQ